MRVAALYDVHGNLPALEAVLADVDAAGAELIVFGGDVAAGPLPAETLDALIRLRRPARFVRGNADRVMVEVYDGETKREGGLADAWVVAQLSQEHRDFLASFEPTVRVDDVLYCHATPSADEPIFTAASPDERVTELIGSVCERLVVCGHTHMQFDRTVAGTRIVNAGSVGMPYAARPGAYWALIDADVAFRRTDYDLRAAAERIRLRGWPQAEEIATENVLSVPSEAEAIAFFERQAATTGA